MNTDTQPRIVAFVCHWCAYGGADHAGGLRLDCPPEVRLVRVRCSGRVDVDLILHAFRAGADGVLVLGCHPGDCHYREGNLRAAKRFEGVRRFLTELGIPPQRFRWDWVAASEGERFRQVTQNMVESLRG